VAWRLSVIIAAVVCSAAALGPPVLPALGIIGGGLLLGLWRRRSGVARLWRWAVIGGLLMMPLVVAQLVTVYGQLLAALLALAALCGVIAGIRRAPVF
jgi:hypothetical protein